MSQTIDPTDHLAIGGNLLAKVTLGTLWIIRYKAACIREVLLLNQPETARDHAKAIAEIVRKAIDDAAREASECGKIEEPMTRFIELTDVDGRPFVISESKVEAIFPAARGGCDLHWDGGITPIKQTYEQIFLAIANASQWAPIIAVKEASEVRAECGKIEAMVEGVKGGEG